MKTKIILLVFLTSTLFLFYSFKHSDNNPVSKQSNSEFSMILDSKKMNFNQISAWYRNNGSFNRDPVTNNSGFEWPRGSSKFARYASGIWLGAIVNGQTLVAIAEFDYEYLPGYIDNNGNPQGQNDPLYKIYDIYRGDTTSSDYQNWPVNQGAYLDENGKPLFLGQQTMFYCYTDGYPEAHTNNAGSTAPLKAQILTHNWCYTRTDLSDVIFSESRIINRSNQTWNDAYISIWTDDDLGTATDDRVGVDSILNLGYTYNANNNDPEYGIAPPAVGFVNLKGAYTSTGNNSDTVRYYSPPGSGNLIVKAGYREKIFSSFNTYINGDPTTGDPQNSTESYYNMQGLKRNGTNWFTPENVLTYFPYSGNPETNTGWIMSGGNDRRFLMNIGPLTMAPNDTQVIRYAQIIAKGSNYTNSVTKLKELAAHVKTVYENNFSGLISVQNISTSVPENFKLHQNYPNPFNPSTNIRFDVKNNSIVKLQIYDLTGRMIEEILNQRFEPGTYEYNWNATGLSSGTYFYKIDIVGSGSEGYSNVKKMILLK